MFLRDQIRQTGSRFLSAWTAVAILTPMVGAMSSGQGSLVSPGEDYGALLALLTVLFFFTGKRREPGPRARRTLMVVVGIMLAAGLVCHILFV